MLTVDDYLDVYTAVLICYLFEINTSMTASVDKNTWSEEYLFWLHLPVHLLRLWDVRIVLYFLSFKPQSSTIPFAFEYGWLSIDGLFSSNIPADVNL